MGVARRCILAIDPGTVKCGIAVVLEKAALPLVCLVVPAAELAVCVGNAVAEYRPQETLLGSGTASESVALELAALGIKFSVVDEYGTTLAARARYFAAHPPKGWKRLVPRGLLLPPVPLDGWAAVVMAEHYLTLQKKIF